MGNPLKKAVRLVEKNVMQRINRTRKRWVVNLMVEPELISSTKALARASRLPIHTYVRCVLADAAAKEKLFTITPAGRK